MVTFTFVLIKNFINNTPIFMKIIKNSMKNYLSKINNFCIEKNTCIFFYAHLNIPIF